MVRKEGKHSWAHKCPLLVPVAVNGVVPAKLEDRQVICNFVKEDGQKCGVELKCRSVNTLASHLRDHGVTEATKFEEATVTATTLKDYFEEIVTSLRDRAISEDTKTRGVVTCTGSELPARNATSGSRTAAA